MHLGALSVQIMHRDLWRCELSYSRHRRSTILCLVSNQDFKRSTAIICHANSIKFENRAGIKLDLSHFDGELAHAQPSVRSKGG